MSQDAPVATERLSLTDGGFVRLPLKTPYRDGCAYRLFIRNSRIDGKKMRIFPCIFPCKQGFRRRVRP